MNAQMNELNEVVSGHTDDRERRSIFMNEEGAVFVAKADAEPEPVTLREALLCYRDIHDDCACYDGIEKFLMAVANQLPQ